MQISNELGALLERVWKDGYIYKNQESDSEVFEQALLNKLIKRGKPIGNEYAEEASFELTSKGLLEMNMWLKRGRMGEGEEND